MSLTIKQIAELAGVSRGTVDRVIHGRYGVKPEVCERVKTIIKELDYKPNLVAKALKTVESSLVFGVLLPSTANDFYKDIEDGIEEAKRFYSSYGVSMIIEVTEMTEKDYLFALKKLISNRLDGLILAALDTPEVIKLLNKSTDNIPVITYNTDFSNSNRLCFVGQDHLVAGRVAADLMNKTIKSKGKVGTLISQYSMLAHIQRIDGFKEVVSKELVTSVMNPLETYESDEIAYKLVSKLIDTEKDLIGIYAASGGQQGVAQAVYDSGRSDDLIVICCDLNSSLVEMVSDGTVDFTIAQYPFAQGYLPLKILYDYCALGVKPKEENIYTPVDIRTKYNVKAKGFEIFTWVNSSWK